MVTADLYNNGNWWLSGYYSRVDAAYNTTASIINPYVEQIGPGDMTLGAPWVEFLLDNPWTAQNTKVMGVRGGLNVGAYPVEVMWSDWKNETTGNDIGSFIGVKVSKDINEKLKGSVSFGQISYDIAAPDVKVLRGQVEATF